MAKPATRTSPRTASRKGAGEALRVHLDGDIATADARYYWIGAMPGCPCDGIDVAGVNFNKVTELVSGQGQKTVRVPRIGGIVRLTERQVDRIKARLPYTVIRFHPTPENPGPDFRRRGHLITIHTKAQVEDRIKANIDPGIYQQGPLDESVADYLFAVPCSDQQNPNPGHTYPAPLSETGLDWE